MKKAVTPIWLKLLLVPFGVMLDQWVKHWAAENLSPFETYEFIPKLVGLIYVENRGAAFGMLQNARWLFIVVTLAAMGVLGWMFFSKKIHGEFGSWAFIAVLTGALGNFIDRVLQGYVVDMFQFQFMNFAIFNVADIFVTVGGTLVCVYLLFFHEKLKNKERETASAAMGGHDDDNGTAGA